MYAFAYVCASVCASVFVFVCVWAGRLCKCYPLLFGRASAWLGIAVAVGHAACTCHQARETSPGCRFPSKALHRVRGRDRGRVRESEHRFIVSDSFYCSAQRERERERVLQLLPSCRMHFCGFERHVVHARQLAHAHTQTHTSPHTLTLPHTHTPPWLASDSSSSHKFLGNSCARFLVGADMPRHVFIIFNKYIKLIYVKLQLSFCQRQLPGMAPCHVLWAEQFYGSFAYCVVYAFNGEYIKVNITGRWRCSSRR